MWNLEDDQIESVYRPQITEKEGQVDLYDFYLGGASPVQVLTSPQAQTDRKLIIFRDSFGSSLAPLLSEVYHEIILIDTRRRVCGFYRCGCSVSVQYIIAESCKYVKGINKRNQYKK